MPGSILVLTGPKNAGKSAFCRGLVQEAAARGVDAAGICTEKQWPQVPPGPAGAMPADGLARPDRLVVTDLRSGRQALLARWMGKQWVMQDEGFVFGREALAAATPCELLIIDEMGRLELRHGSGWTEALGILARGAYRQAVVTVREGCFGAFRNALDQAARFGPPPLRLYRLHSQEAPGARQRLQQQVLSRLVPSSVQAVGR